MRSQTKVIKEFWKTREDYPPFPHNYRRRYVDLGVIFNYTDNIKSILDLGCGPGHLLLMLRELTDIEYFYGYDLSKNFIESLKTRWGSYKKLVAKATNFLGKNLPKTDMSLCTGTLLYIFDDFLIEDMILSSLQSNIFIVRAPCSTKRLEINKFSKELNSQYATIYRTADEYNTILSKGYKDIDIFRAYPDEIESKYGSKQFFFVCKNRR